MKISMPSGKMYQILWLALLLCGFLLASCSSPAQTPSVQNSAAPTGSMAQAYLASVDNPVSSAGCGHASSIQPGTSANMTVAVNPAVSLGLHARMYRVHVPTSYTMNRAQALVLVYHGYAGTSQGMEQTTGFSSLADQEDFLAVYPQGMMEPRLGKPFFAELGPIDFGVDEVSFASDMLNDLQKKFCIDAHRIYSTGFSNGGGLSALFACRFAGRIAAIAPVEGPFNDIPGGCHPTRPISILDIHGTNDQSVPYNGIPASKDPPWPYPAIQQWLQDWATRDGCTSKPVMFLNTSRVAGEQWRGCRDNTAVAHYRIIGGTHSWPTTINGQSIASAIWQFFQTHPMIGA